MQAVIFLNAEACKIKQKIIEYELDSRDKGSRSRGYLNFNNAQFGLKIDDRIANRMHEKVIKLKVKIKALQFDIEMNSNMISDSAKQDKEIELLNADNELV